MNPGLPGKQLLKWRWPPVSTNTTEVYAHDDDDNDADTAEQAEQVSLL